MIDWQASAAAIYRQYLACYGWPETFTFFQRRRVILREIQEPRPATGQDMPCGSFTCDRRTKSLCVRASDGLITGD